ncbi:MAG: leucine-rich repeat domain-containing protein [Clostridiales bacterium]|nr:leucine-rich repeat domain-containing protein [Clostridiales bacterium]
MRSKKMWIAIGMAAVVSVTSLSGAFSMERSQVNAEETEIVVEAEVSETAVKTAETSEAETISEAADVVIEAEEDVSDTEETAGTEAETETEENAETEAEDGAFVIEISEEETSGISDEEAEDLASIVANESVTFDSSAWQYNSSSDVYYQTGVVYCDDPYDTTYESFGIYVPGAYMNTTSNGDGTYTLVSFTTATVGNYTASTAPIVIPVNTAGYSAQAAPTGFSSGVTTYTSAGIIYLYAGCRGRDTTDGGAPWGVTDLKAAIHYYRANASVLPGDTDSFFTFGHSGGGAQSAVVGASGDSALYYPYLYAIGAAGITYNSSTGTYTSTISDAVCGSMCWCPITSLDYADEAYEWMMGQYSSSGTRADGTWTSLLSDDMSAAFAAYINSLTLVDESGNRLSLTDEDSSGIYITGSYYEYLLLQIEYSLNDFIDSYTDSSGNFTYSSSGSSSSGTPGGSTPDGNTPGGDMSGSLPDGDLGGDMGAPTAETTSDSDDALTAYLLTLDENYGSDGAWITYDESTGWYSISSVEDFVLYGSKAASKDVGAFDDLGETQAENYVFGNGLNAGAHFDSIMASLLLTNYTTYAAADSSVPASDVYAYATAYQSDYESYTTDSLLNYSSQYRQNMYNPMYYLCQDYSGYGTSTPASYWRINTGITQSDTSLTVEMNLYLSLLEDVSAGTVKDVDFSMLWAQGHTTAERAGADSDASFISWINTCMTGGSSSGTNNITGSHTGSSSAGSTTESTESAESENTGSDSTESGSEAATESETDTAASNLAEVGSMFTNSAGTLNFTVTGTGASPTATCTGAADTSVTTITVPATVISDGVTYTVTSIESGAFKKNTKLVSVKIGSNITDIGASAFQGCTNLSSVTVGSAVTSIGASAFYNCKALTSIRIPSSVKTIGEKAFAKCTSLQTVTGCAAVTTVGSKAFYGDTQLTGVKGLQAATSVKSGAFYGCVKLNTIGATSERVTLASVKTIGVKAFYGCKKITYVNLTSAALKTIKASAFQGCTALKTFVSKSAKLKTIGSKAFYGDKKLAAITLKTKKLTGSTVGDEAFTGIKSTCKCNVPNSMAAAYKTLFVEKGAGSTITVE